MPDYGYLNARLRGMKTCLLSGQEYEKMLTVPGLKELTEVLATTSLKKSLEVALIRYGGLEALEVAAKADFAAACRKVLSISEGEQKKLVAAILRRWDVFNIKTVLRGKHSHTSPVEMLRNVVPAGDLDTLALQEMTAQPGVREVVDLLATWGSPLAEPLVESLEGYTFDKHLVRLELALDRASFAATLREAAGPGPNARLVRSMARAQIDIANLMAKIRLVLDDVDTFVETKEERLARERREREEARRKAMRRPRVVKPRALSPRRKSPAFRERPPLPPIQDYFLPGGEETGGDRLVALLRTRTMGDLLAFLEETSFDRFVSADMRELESIPDLAAFERSLEADLIRRMTSLYRREPIGIAMAISYLWMKHTEFINLRILTRGKEFGIPDHILRSELVHA